jgi:hypothetical protein
MKTTIEAAALEKVKELLRGMNGTARHGGGTTDEWVEVIDLSREALSLLESCTAKDAAPEADQVREATERLRDFRLRVKGNVEQYDQDIETLISAAKESAQYEALAEKYCKEVLQLRAATKGETP